MSLKLEVQFNAKTTMAQLKTVMAKLNRLPTEALNHFVSITPIDKGNARRSTSLTGNKTIHANYAYAQRLDQGYSKQFGGKGMTKPTEKFIRDRVKQIEAGK
jgi:hypothetical protein